MFRYRRREWDESRGVAYLPARVLTDRGRINPAGSARAVARRRPGEPSQRARHLPKAPGAGPAGG